MPKVGLIKGNDRFDNVLNALKHAGDEVKHKIKGKAVVKINTVMEDEPAANTHAVVLRALLEFLKPLDTGRVIVGEASCNGTELFKRCGYTDLLDDYDFELLDFNTTGYENVRYLHPEAFSPVEVISAVPDFFLLI